MQVRRRSAHRLLNFWTSNFELDDEATKVHLTPASPAARSRRSGSAAVPTAASGTRSSKSAGAGVGAGGAAAAGAWAAVARGCYADVDTVVSERHRHRHQRVRSRARRRHRARARSCCSAASRGSASRRCCCRPRRISPRRVGPVLYCSGEESEHQIKMRGERLGVGRAPLYLLAETCVERLIEEVDRLKPALLIVDSIQTVFSLKMPSAPGSVGQVRQAATDLLFTAKGRNLPTILVGHVTKDGSLAGPKVLEHVVDTVLYFEGAAASRASRRARGEESVRRRQRAGRVRDDGRRAACRCRIRRSCFSPSGRRTCPARPCCARSKARGRSSSRCRRS